MSNTQDTKLIGGDDPMRFHWKSSKHRTTHRLAASGDRTKCSRGLIDANDPKSFDEPGKWIRGSRVSVEAGSVPSCYFCQTTEERLALPFTGENP